MNIRLKAKLVLTVFLPVFILILFIKTADTYIRIKIRKLFTGPVNSTPVPDNHLRGSDKPVPVKMTTVEKEILHPEPVSADR
jgi:hypothetical protein